MTEPTSHQNEPEGPARPWTIDRYLDGEAARLHAAMIAGAVELLRLIDDGAAVQQLLHHELLETYKAGLMDGLRIWEEHGGSGMPDAINIYMDDDHSAPDFQVS